MAPAPLDDLSPPGSSSYSSNTMVVGDGTWDSTKNDFLLPNLVGLNFETMQYNGMSNRFSTLDQYHRIILAHGLLAVVAFLFIIPAAVFTVRFYSRHPGNGVRYHSYLNILAVLVTTVVFILGFFAVGPSRSLTNPHHGIGVAIYTLMLIQLFGGNWVRSRLRAHPPLRPPIKLMLHQWLGRLIALLGIVQIPLGLTLYGSPKFTFVLYTLWMTFLLLLYFIYEYRAGGVAQSVRYSRYGGGEVIEERKRGGGFGTLLASLAAGGLIAALLGRRNKDRDDRDERERVEVISSRRNSGRRDSESFEEIEKYEEDDRHRGGGLMSKVLAGAAVVGAGALAKSWWDNRRAKREEREYASVAPDTPSRRHGRVEEVSDYSESVVTGHRPRLEGRRHGGPLLPGPGDPVAAAAALSAAEPRPVTPRPVGRPARHHSRVESYDSYDDSVVTPRRHDDGGHAVRNTVAAGLGGIGLGWLGKRWQGRKARQEQERLDKIRAQEREDELRFEQDRRSGRRPPRFTGDGALPPRRRPEMTESSLSSDSSRIETRPGTSGLMPPLAAGAIPVAGGAIPPPQVTQTASGHNIINPVPMPPGPPRDGAYVESGSEAYISAGGHDHRRHRRREEEAAAAAATAGAALAASEIEERRRRDQSHSGYRSGGTVGVDTGPAASVKVRMHGDPNRRVTLRRLTEEELAAQQAVRGSGSRRRRASSASSLSGSGDAGPSRRYRRHRSASREAAELEAERRAEAANLPPLSPPRPAFAGGKQKDSAYYSRPPESVGSPESHGTWSGMSPSVAGEDPAERRRRRRMERQRQGGGASQAGTVEYT